jgi:hypothetical protein
MRHRKTVRAYSWGVWVALMLLAGIPSTFAQAVLASGAVRAAGGSVITRYFSLPPHTTGVLTVAGNVHAETLNGFSNTLVSLDIALLPGEGVVSPCGIDRMWVTDGGGFNLFASASCVKVLRNSTTSTHWYRLRARQEVSAAVRKSLALDFVLTAAP